jgi:hypothetical protein
MVPAPVAGWARTEPQASIVVKTMRQTLDMIGLHLRSTLHALMACGASLPVGANGSSKPIPSTLTTARLNDHAVAVHSTPSTAVCNIPADAVRRQCGLSQATDGVIEVPPSLVHRAARVSNGVSEVQGQ